MCHLFQYFKYKTLVKCSTKRDNVNSNGCMFVLFIRTADTFIILKSNCVVFNNIACIKYVVDLVWFWMICGRCVLFAPKEVMCLCDKWAPVTPTCNINSRVALSRHIWRAMNLCQTTSRESSYCSGFEIQRQNVTQVHRPLKTGCCGNQEFRAIISAHS